MRDFAWFPLLIVVAGVAHFVYYKYVVKYPEDLLERLDSMSFSGQEGDRYRPITGQIMIGVGLVLLVVFNLSWLGLV